ncbi:energy transducer TonB [Treponema sp. R80B11-R83G3]
MNEKYLRLIIFIITAALHLLVIFFLVFKTGGVIQEISENARVMKLTDIDELPPPPPEEPEIPQVEEIAEVMIETDIPPVQNVVPAGTLNVTVENYEDYLKMHEVSKRPIFNEEDLTSALIYPPIALRSGIEGRVVLELFVDRAGFVQKITVLREEPEGKGFGEAAVKAFTGRKGTPAFANDEPVSCRYRYPVVFRIK